MKVKKLLIGLLVSGLALSFTGCGDNGTITKEGNKYHIFGQFVEIKKIRFRDPMAYVDVYVHKSLNIIRHYSSP